MKRDSPLRVEDAASVDALPTWPDAWYVVARSIDVRRKRIIDGRIGQRPFVAYRDRAGALVVLPAHCPHMGAHLRHAEVVDGGLRCALHHRTVGPDGHFGEPGACARRPPHAWHVFERFGLVFVHVANGHPAPRPFAEVPDDFAWMALRPVRLGADWRAIAVNGFDTEHMRAVHQREVVRAPDFAKTADGALQMRYETRILERGGWSSWLVGRLSKGTPRITQTCHGPTLLVESRLGAFESRAVVGLMPDGDGTLAFAAVGAPRGGPLRSARLRLTQALYGAFLRKDIAIVEGMRLAIDGIDDPGVRAIGEYLRSLPESEAAHAR